jgi:DNA-binding transcriptional regulator YdaS (Cro superfamily)
MQTESLSGAAKPAHLTTVADLDAVMRARSDARRRQEAEDKARRLAVRRTAKAAQTSHILSVPRMVGLMQAGVLLGSAKALADALGIQPRSLRKKTDSERGVSCEDLRAAADALDARAALMIEHAAKLRAEAVA